MSKEIIDQLFNLVKEIDKIVKDKIKKKKINESNFKKYKADIKFLINSISPKDIKRSKLVEHIYFKCMSLVSHSLDYYTKNQDRIEKYDFLIKEINKNMNEYLGSKSIKSIKKTKKK